MYSQFLHNYIINDISNIILNYLQNEQILSRRVVPKIQEIILDYVYDAELKYQLYENNRFTVTKIELDTYCTDYEETGDIGINYFYNLPSFTQFPNLKKLISNEFYRYMVTPTLEHLELKNSYDLTNDHIKVMPNLKVLRIPNNENVTFQGLIYLRNLELLEVPRYIDVYSKNKRFHTDGKEEKITIQTFWYLPKLKRVIFNDRTVSADLKIFATNYNILRIMDGSAGLRYSS